MLQYPYPKTCGGGMPRACRHAAINSTVADPPVPLYFLTRYFMLKPLSSVAILFIAGLVLSFAATTAASAQDVPPGQASPGLTSPLENPNRFARPGMPTNEVWVWGEVSQPGIWRVERGADLVQFLSHLRVQGALSSDPERIRRFTVRIYRGEPRAREEIYSIRMDRLLEEGDDYPAFQDGDILAVEVRQRRSRLRIFQTVVSAISSAASLTLLFLRLRDGRL